MQKETGGINIDLVQDILRKAEKFSPFFLERQYKKAEYDPLIANHVQILFENEYINVVMAESSSIIPNWRILGLTERGQSFLNLLQKESVWRDLNENIYGRDLSINEIENLAQSIDREKQFDAKSQRVPVVPKPNLGESIANNIVENNLKIETPLTETESVPPVDEAAAPDETDLPPGVDDSPQIADALPTVQMCNVGDQPTADDKLGFKPYVEAIAKFLTDEKTKGPFTLSVEGEWGSGKSSFMLQVEAELKRIDPKILTVHFNAWRYDKEDALWAAFAMQVVKQLKQKVDWKQRYKATWQLFWRRFNLKKGWFSLVSFGLVIVSLSFLLILIISGSVFNLHPPEFLKGIQDFTENPELKGLIKVLTLSAAGYVILYIFALRKIKELLINPLSVDVKKHITAPDYQQRATFLDEFHDDFNKIIEAYAGKGEEARKVFVFIDDLDRCEVPKSAELMQALNLMLSETPQLFFIIGMDREKVAAGLAVKHEKLLGYLYPAPKNAVGNTNPGLEFGFEFIEKFIQVPFKVPQPRGDDIGNLITALGGKITENNSSNNKSDWSSVSNRSGYSFNIPKGDSTETTISEDKRRIEPKPPKQEDVDSKEVAEVIKTVAPFFDYNPRRIKQFLNIYRLKIYIGNETGLFNQPSPESTYQRINLYKLGRFVAINLRYPLLIAELEDNPQLLDELQAYALDGKLSENLTSNYWLSKLRLIKLLKENLEDKETRDESKFALSNINLNQLLQISPTVKPLQANVAQNLQKEQSILA